MGWGPWGRAAHGTTGWPYRYNRFGHGCPYLGTQTEPTAYTHSISRTSSTPGGTAPVGRQLAKQILQYVTHLSRCQRGITASSNSRRHGHRSHGIYQPAQADEGPSRHRLPARSDIIQVRIAESGFAISLDFAGMVTSITFQSQHR